MYVSSTSMVITQGFWMINTPIISSIFRKYGYTFEGMDIPLLKKILKEEGYSKKEIDSEIIHIERLGLC